MTMKFFEISPHDLDCYAFRQHPRLTPNQRLHQAIVPDMSGAARADVQRCPACGELLDKWNEPLTGLRIKKRTWDIGTTYDGIVVASRKFKKIYDDHGLRGLCFRSLPDDPEYFSILPERVVGFDADRSEIEFIGLCSHCDQYKEVIGGMPVMLKGNPRIDPEEFVRTDLEFASEDEKHPLILCGELAARVLRDSRIKNLLILDPTK